MPNKKADSEQYVRRSFADELMDRRPSMDSETREIIQVLCRIEIQRAQRVMLKLSTLHPVEGFGSSALGTILDFEAAQVHGAMSALRNRINGTFGDSRHRGIALFFDVQPGDGEARYVPRAPLLAAIENLPQLAHYLERSVVQIEGDDELLLAPPPPEQPLRTSAADVAIKVDADASRRSLDTMLDELPVDAQPRARREIQRVLRDARLRHRVLAIWDGKCACCGLRLEGANGELECEVAHVREVRNEGADLVSNALPLCRTHHWAFDRQLWGIAPADLRIEVATPWRTHPAMQAIHGQTLKIPDAAAGCAPLERRFIEDRWRQFRAIVW